jgi:hypothetical protein
VRNSFSKVGSKWLRSERRDGWVTCPVHPEEREAVRGAGGPSLFAIDAPVVLRRGIEGVPTCPVHPIALQIKATIQPAVNRLPRANFGYTCAMCHICHTGAISVSHGHLCCTRAISIKTKAERAETLLFQVGVARNERVQRG